MRPVTSAAFAALIALATAHDSMDMDMAHNAPEPTPATHTPDGPISYFAYGKHSSSIIAHIALMVAAWCFVLPIGKVDLNIRKPQADFCSCHTQYRTLQTRAPIPVPVYGG